MIFFKDFGGFFNDMLEGYHNWPPTPLKHGLT